MSANVETAVYALLLPLTKAGIVRWVTERMTIRTNHFAFSGFGADSRRSPIVIACSRQTDFLVAFVVKVHNPIRVLFTAISTGFRFQISNKLPVPFSLSAVGC